MNGLTDIFQHALPFTAVLSRVGGVFLFTPLLSSVMIPAQVRALVVVMLSLALYPMIPVSHMLGREISLFDVVPLFATEMLIGVSIGMLASIPLLLAQVAGVIMGQQMGLSLGQTFNPALDIESDVIGELLFYLGIGAFLLIGGIELIFSALMQTFSIIPLDSFSMGEAPLDAMVGLLEAGLNLAMRISMPVLAVIFIETLVIGVLMKTVPGLNVLAFGFPIRIIIGLMALVAAVGAIAFTMENEIANAFDAIHDWIVASARPPSPARGGG